MIFHKIHSIWFAFMIQEGWAYFHIPSSMEFQSPDGSNSFGYSIGYLSSFNSLVVGDPLNGKDGEVYSCPISDLQRKTSTCKNMEIDIDKYAGDYNRSQSPDQNFCLGASVSVTPDYFLTCAPMWTSFTRSSQFGAFGTCFVSNGTHVDRYYGLTERYYKGQSKDVDMGGGIGWNTLSDQPNKIILIAKPALQSTISYMQINEPLNSVNTIDLSEIYKVYGYIGQSIAVGQFFGTKRLYAVSMIRKTEATGAIYFFDYDTTTKKFKMYRDGKESILIEDSSVNSMFGVALHGANLNFDNFTELLVGAPAQNNSARSYEQGAVHIYVGGVNTERKTMSDLCIYATVDGSRFGTAIESLDLDGDGLSEIFISAPYEDTGVIYVLPGLEISSLLHMDLNYSVPVSSLNNVQRIVNADIKSFGVSLLSIVDVDKNGLNALVIGSLSSNKVLLYKSMPVINVTIYTNLDVEIVREQDKNFTVTVTVHVGYSTKQKINNGKLFVTTRVDGVGASIEKNKYELILKDNINSFNNNILVSLDDDEPGDYKFTAIVEADKENLKRSDYDSSLYIINPYSRVRDAIDVKRRCRGDDCVPKLSLTFEWTGGSDEYVLGSSENENMTLLVRNDGNTTYQSCARVRVTGVQFKIPDCVLELDDWYRCDFVEIGRHDTYSVELQLDMTRKSNRDKNFKVDVTLANNCAAAINLTVIDTKVVTYALTTTEIYIKGINLDRNVTDSVINNEDIQDIDVHEVYFVTNNGTVTWKSIRAVIELKKETFIKNYTVTTASTIHCSEENTEQILRINCIFDLNPNSSVKFPTVINIIKKDIMDTFEDGKLRVMSNFTLYLEPTDETRVESLTTTVTYQVDGGIGNNKNVIIAASLLIGFLILFVVILVLHKIGFFKREEKNKLDELKEVIRRESTRRPKLNDTDEEDADEVRNIEE